MITGRMTRCVLRCSDPISDVFVFSGTVVWLLELGHFISRESYHRPQSCRICGRRCAYVLLMKSSLSICNAFPVSMSISLSPSSSPNAPQSQTFTQVSNDTTSGISISRRHHQTSSVRTVCCRQRGGFCRIAPVPASADSW